MKLLWLILIVILAASPQQQYTLIKKIELPGHIMSTDPLGNCYVVSKNRLYKYDQDGNPVNNYSNNNFAEIASIDATNPYKILVFYKSFGKLIFLDNMLSANGDPIDLLSSDFNQTSLACHSFDNGFWIYEPILNEMFKLNNGLNVFYQSGNLSRALRQTMNPDFLIEYNSRVYMNNPATGILVFDQYGTYLKSLPLKYVNSFQVKDDRIHFIKDRQLNTYYFKSLETDTTELPVSNNIRNVQIQKKRLYILTDSSLQIYRIN